MKKVFSFLILAFAQLITVAQEVVEEPARYASKEEWTMETKLWLAVVFAILTIWLVARTYRNKPEA